jgi:hypothetical protein
MICGLCRQGTEKLVKSHIIPKAMMIDGLGESEKIAIAGTAGHPKRSPVGIWSKIVCPDCEKSFGKDDEYLISVYRKIDQFPTAFEGEATLLKDVDARKLQRAILSVFFRAHLSDHELFKSVHLDHLAEELRNYILGTKESIPASFSICLRHVSNAIGGLIIQPIRENYDGIHAYRFFLPKITAIIRADKEDFREPFKSLQIIDGQEVYAMRFDRLTPSEYRIGKKIILHNGEDRLKSALGIKDL